MLSTSSFNRQTQMQNFAVSILVPTRLNLYLTPSIEPADQRTRPATARCLAPARPSMGEDYQVHVKLLKKLGTKMAGMLPEKIQDEVVTSLGTEQKSDLLVGNFTERHLHERTLPLVQKQNQRTLESRPKLKLAVKKHPVLLDLFSPNPFTDKWQKPSVPSFRDLTLLQFAFPDPLLMT